MADHWHRERGIELPTCAKGSYSQDELEVRPLSRAGTTHWGNILLPGSSLRSSCPRLAVSTPPLNSTPPSPRVLHGLEAIRRGITMHQRRWVDWRCCCDPNVTRISVTLPLDKSKRFVTELSAISIVIELIIDQRGRICNTTGLRYNSENIKEGG